MWCSSIYFFITYWYDLMSLEGMLTLNFFFIALIFLLPCMCISAFTILSSPSVKKNHSMKC